MIIGAFVIISIVWLLIRRYHEKFIRAYGLFFLVLLFFVMNKGEGNQIDEFSEGVFSPLSMLRWISLGWLLWVSLRTPRPDGHRSDAALWLLGGLLLADILISTFYAEDFSYSFMRATSFIILAAAIPLGFFRHLYWRLNCIRFFRLHYYIAWCLLVPAMLLHLAGLHNFGVSVIMGSYAGPFANQNMFGIFSAFTVPYVLFHWHVEARGMLMQKLDAILLAILVIGLWLSNSRSGMLACITAVAIYYFVINTKNRLKILAAAACLVLGLLVFSDVRHEVMRFVRKDTVERAEVTDLSSQFYQERRYELWSNILPLYWEKKMRGYGFAMSHQLTLPFSGNRYSPRHAHNSYIELFGDLGLPGLILLLLVLYLVSLRSIALIQRSGGYLQRNINAVFIAIFISGTINAFFESWMFSAGSILSLMFWGPAAGVIAQWVWEPATAADYAKVMQINRRGREQVEAAQRVT
ncbi:MAG: O-antigen ligase family protein [Blastocatellia bacterium]|nr:O-antigen ligase family protein [Blastocatellia bacterium]